MYPCHGDFWLVGNPPTQNYGYDELEEYDYDVYLYWPSSSHGVLMPADSDYSDEPISPLELGSDTTDDELEVLEIGPSQLLSLSPTFTVDPDFVFPSDESTTQGLDENGYSRLFRMGLVSKSRKFTRHLDDILKGAWQTVASSLRCLKLSR
ncbi:hypothetical protein BDW22DRAFT_1342137 [Trametopsis cervina]|nr:hypothetical protein BDW22DRAFT_1342137 [Trametopsis cervina]